MKPRHALLAGLLLVASLAAAPAANGQGIDVERAKQVMQKAHAGQPLTPEEQAYLQRVREALRKQRGESPGQASKGAAKNPGASAGNMPPNYGVSEWVDSDKTLPEFTQFKTFLSKTVNADVSYAVYLPPTYEQDTAARYPVLYELPASGGTPKRDLPGILSRVDKLIRAGSIRPMIVIGVNGLRGNTMYCDSRDGRWPLETVIIKDLIPHVDATYRTIAARAARGVEGFSMGGFGAAHLGLKFPELFGVISIKAPPLVEPDSKWHQVQQAWGKLFPTAMANDMEYFKANDPFNLAVQNADKLRDHTYIRLTTHVLTGEN